MTAAEIAWAGPCALGAAASFGVANVAQMRAARRTEAALGIDLRLLVRLARDRLWLLGLAASVVGYGLQAIALFHAPVVVVQPLIVTELVFALPLAAVLAGSRMDRRDWAGAWFVTAGLATLIVVARPDGHRTDASGRAWLSIMVVVALGVAALLLVARRHRHLPMLRGSALAVAASACFGLVSVLTRTVTHQFDDHRLGALRQPQPWLLVVVALTGLLIAQTAFRASPLSVSLPLIDIGEPLIGSLIAVAVFGEHLVTGPTNTVAVVAAALPVATGVALLDTSPRVRTAQRQLTGSTERALRSQLI